MPSLLDSPYPIYDTDLLRQLHGRQLSGQLQTLCVIGAHRFQEYRLVNRIFPNLRRIYLFEPLAEPLKALRETAARDPRIRVFPVAISDSDGHAQFHVTSNDGESSSLLAFGSHSELFPQVRVSASIDVPTRRLASLIAQEQLTAPDVLLVDVQGAEYQVLNALGEALLSQVRLIYAEVSTERVYASSRLLAEVEQLLAPRFVNLGFAPLRSDVAMHGNAVFAARSDVEQALALTALGRFHHAWRGWRRQRQARKSAKADAAAVPR